MVWAGLANVCSHIQNASRARLGITSVPSNKMTLGLMVALHNQGFLSFVTRGGIEPPTILTPTAMPHATNDADIAEATITQENVATRRLWVGLKYWNQQPVLNGMGMVTKPSKKISLTFRELENVVRGREQNTVKGMRQPGECLFVATDQGILESRECVKKKIGGLAICRVT